MVRPCHEEAFEFIKPLTKPGPGMAADTVLTKDELNIILDLEEERTRMGDFQPIFPLKETAGSYYGYMEIPRYQNALYCAWLATSPDRQQAIIKKNTE